MGVWLVYGIGWFWKGKKQNGKKSENRERATGEKKKW